MTKVKLYQDKKSKVSQSELFNSELEYEDYYGDDGSDFVKKFSNNIKDRESSLDVDFDLDFSDID